MGKAWRAHWRASVFLAVVAGLVAGVVGASFQAAGRADTSLDRFSARSRRYDLVVQGCPPGVDPATLHGQADTLAQCVNVARAEEFRKVLARQPGVEGTAVTTSLVVGLLDPTVSNHWGRLTLLSGIATPRTTAVGARPIVLEGRLPDPAAPDEVVLSEDAARITGLHAGDVARLAGWLQEDLDAAIDGTVAPETAVVPSKVVGVVRNLDDVQSSGGGTLSEGIPGDFNVAAGPAWMAAHAAGFPGYGSAVLVRLRGGPSSVRSFEALLDTAPGGWFNQASPVVDTDSSSIRRVIDLERNALLVFAGVAILAGVAFVGLTVMRQLTRESAESRLLLSLGMTRRDLHVLNVARALTIAAWAGVVAVVTIVALSPLGPLGLARKLEFDLGVRFDLLVVATTVLAIVLFFAVVGLMTPVAVSDDGPARLRVRPSRFEPALQVVGPVATVGANVARGRSSRAAVAVTVVAVAAAIAAGSLVASYDRLVREPRRYGAWWDVAVGQYSEPSALAEGVAKLRANSAVVAAAGYLEQADVAAVDGSSTRILALRSYVGHRGPVMARGRAPTSADEVALGRATAQRIHKSVGDHVTVVSSDDTRLRLRVVGIVVVNDPVSTQASAGDGVFVRPSAYNALAGPGSIPQSLVIRLDPHRDRAAAIESVRRDFAGSIREVGPQVGARDLGRLRTVPWLIAALIALLALATFVHALLTVLARNRTTLAVLAVLGFRRRQRRRVGLFASLLLVASGIAIGVPVGLLLGSAVWTAVADGIDLPSGAVLAWPEAVAATIAAFGVAVVVALVATTGPLRTTPSEQLRVE